MATQLAGSVRNTQEQFPYMQGLLLLSPGHMGNDTDYWNVSAIMVTCPIWSVDKSLNYIWLQWSLDFMHMKGSLHPCMLTLIIQPHTSIKYLNLQLATKNTGLMPGKLWEEHYIYRHQCTENYWTMLVMCIQSHNVVICNIIGCWGIKQWVLSHGHRHNL